MAEDKLRVHLPTSDTKPRDVTSQAEVGSSSRAQNPRDIDKNPTSRLSDDMNALMKRQGGAPNLYKSYHPGMQPSVHQDSASATLAREPFSMSQNIRTKENMDHGGARPKTKQSNTVISVSSLQNEDVDQSSADKEAQIQMKVLCPGDSKVTLININCDINTYMKWQFLLKSPTRLNEINMRADKQFNLTNECVLLFKEKHDEPCKRSEQVLSVLVNEFGKGLKVEQVYVSDGEAQGIADKLASLAISVIHILYVEPISNGKICLVYEANKENSVKEQIEILYPRFSVRIALPIVWQKLSEKINLKEKLQTKSGTVRITFAEWKDINSYVCDIFGRFFVVAETAGKLNFFKQSLRSKTLNISANMVQAMKALKLCDILQMRIDKDVKGFCLLEETQSRVELFYFKNEPIDNWISLMQSWLCEEVIDIPAEWRNRSSIEKVQKKLDAECGKKVLLIQEHNGCVIVGLKEDVQNAMKFLKTFQFYSSFDNIDNIFTRKCSVKDEDFLDTQIMLANEIAKKNNITVDLIRKKTGNSFTFMGSQEGVEQACREFKSANIDIKKEEVTINKALAKSKQILEFFGKLETEQKVKVLMDKINVVKGGEGARESRAIMEKSKNRCTWTFPSGRKVIIDFQDSGVWTEPEIIVEVAEKEPSIKDHVKSAFTEFRSGQKRAAIAMPKWNGGGREQTTKVNKKLRQILDKAKEQNLHSVGILLGTVGDWPFMAMIETLLQPISKHIEHCENGDVLKYPLEVIFCCRSIDMFKKVDAVVCSIIDPKYVEKGIQIDVVSGELNLFEADILVNTTSPKLNLNHGSVSAAILRTAGPELQLECTQNYPEGVIGRIVAVTQGYGLKCQYVIHGALHKYRWQDQAQSLQELRDFLESCLDRAVKLKATSIAFPVIGSGNLGFPPDLVASEMFSAVEKLRLHEQESSLRFVYFVVYHQDKETLKIFQKVHDDMVKFLAKDSKASLISSADSEMKLTQPELMTIKVIGKTSNVDQAVKDLQEQYKQPVAESSKHGLADSQMKQIVQDIQPHEYAILLKVFAAEFENIKDIGVKLHYEENMIKFHGKINKISDSVREVKDMLQVLRNMYHIKVSVVESDKQKVKSDLRQISRNFPEIYNYYDEILAIVHLYGRKPDHIEDVKKAGSFLGKYKDERVETAKDKMSGAALYKPTVQRNFSWTINTKNLQVYQVGSLVVRVYEGDLLEAPVDCIVNAANKDLQHGGGIAHAIAVRAGDELKKECFYITQQASLTVGSVVQTTAGNLPYKYILHTVGPCWYDYQPITNKTLKQCEDDLFAAICNTFRKAEELMMESIALPAISSAIFRVPLEICAVQYCRAVMSLAKGTTYLKEIFFVDKDAKTIAMIQDVFKCMISEDKPFDINKTVYLDVTERKRSGSTGRNTKKKEQENDEKSSSMGGMLLLNPICKMEGSKMICLFSTCQEIHIHTGNILEQNGIDAIVCSEDKSFEAAGIVARELLKKGGEEYKRAKAEAHRKNSTMKEGDVVISMGGRNKFPWVIHALIPNSKPLEDLKILMEDILEKCVKKGFKSIVMSLLGSGQGKKLPELCAKQLLMAYENFCIRNPGYKFTLYIINIKKEITSAIQSTFREYINYYGKSRMNAELTMGEMAMNENHFSSTISLQSEAGSLSRSSKSSLKTTEEKTATKLTSSYKDGDEIVNGKVEQDSKGGPIVNEENNEKAKKVVEELPAICVICMDKLENPKTLKCGHIFCAECIDQYFKVKPVCPTCFTVCGVITGDQPDGVMEIMKLRTSVTGYENYGSFGVSYRFDSGRQGPKHPNPEAWYAGINRTAYLPNTEEGRKICAMLRVAFERRLVFTIGTSRTTGQEGVITWNDIHHKTDHRPNTQFGYPDATYLMRVKEELSVKGVMEEDIDQDFLKQLNDPGFNRKDFQVFTDSK